MLSISNQEPWSLDDQAYLKDHVFFRGLKKTAINVERIVSSIEAISDDFWNELNEIVPDEWKSNYFLRIRSHIDSIRDNSTKFENNIRRFLQ